MATERRGIACWGAPRKQSRQFYPISQVKNQFVPNKSEKLFTFPIALETVNIPHCLGDVRHLEAKEQKIEQSNSKLMSPGTLHPGKPTQG
ncbi:hypothetical protein BHE74_00032281 [Ensete ventricosum]|nr:hypothetical protein BHE74_00032281 [Ensete ventricosum]